MSQIIQDNASSFIILNVCIYCIFILLTSIIEGMKNTTITSTMSTIDKTPDPDCPYNFEAYNGNCYSFSNDRAIFSDAETNCNKLGRSYHLVIIKDENENNFLKTMILSRTNDEQHWIGLRRLDSRDKNK